MKSIIAAATAIFLAGTSSGQATILRDTIGGDVYGAPALGWTVGDVGSGSPYTASIGLGFSAATLTQVNGIEAYIGPSGLGLSTVFTLGIMQDNGSGVPAGTFLWSTILSASAAQPALLNNLNWSIGAGSYFLVAIADNSALNSWQFNTVQSGAFSYTTGETNSGWVLGNGALPEAIISTENISAVPLHPSAWPSAILGSLMMGWIAYRRRMRVQPSS